MTQLSESGIMSVSSLEVCLGYITHIEGPDNTRVQNKIVCAIAVGMAVLLLLSAAERSCLKGFLQSLGSAEINSKTESSLLNLAHGIIGQLSARANYKPHEACIGT